MNFKVTEGHKRSFYVEDLFTLKNHSLMLLCLLTFYTCDTTYNPYFFYVSINSKSVFAP